MTLLVGLVMGGAAAIAIWAGLRPVFGRPVFARQNYRGVTLPTAGGIVIPLAVIATSAVLTLATTLGSGPEPSAMAALALTVTATLGFGLLGLLDDVALDEGASGYRGHVTALVRGRLTAGSLKMVAGPAVAILVVAPVADDSAARLLLDGAVVALAANLANLFDRAPGRVAKVSLAAAAVLVVATAAAPELLGLAVVSGAALALVVPDLRERMMLGDAGANPLGATLGLATVLAVSPTTRNWVLAVLLALNLVSERVSFSRVIERVPPLRAIDRAGRRRTEA
jgi:UDP-N-acetylmuramyl pentapeptide phosphotransferase/UDP-N-acetylglucosamine-1-phosphate transferase